MVDIDISCMQTKVQYPRVLVVALGRINASDSFNNGLLLRNLFAGWPRDSIAQIYSSGDTGDAGFFGSYYRLGPQDRRLGRLFYNMKEMLRGKAKTVQSRSNTEEQNPPRHSSFRSLFVDTGLYELIFSPAISTEMLNWVNSFRPDIILSQGYNLTFARLPVLLKAMTQCKLAFFCSDDWPTYLYSGMLGEPRFLCRLVRPFVHRAVAKLLSATDVPLAFGYPMAEEYEKRYNKKFTVLSHADDRRRFESVQTIRIHSAGTFTLMAIGNFNQYRWPLLLDANESCRLLSSQGIPTRLAVLSSMIDPEGARQLAKSPYIDIYDDPGNDRLPCYLKGANVLLLAEGFDGGFVSAISLSVSSKAHLFMMSQRPILVYAHSGTGIARYASAHRWAKVVSRRDKQALTKAIRDLLADSYEADALVVQANNTSQKFHSHEVNQARLLNALTGNSNSTE